MGPMGTCLEKWKPYAGHIILSRKPYAGHIILSFKHYDQWWTFLFAGLEGIQFATTLNITPTLQFFIINYWIVEIRTFCPN
jgi:hypothetical protein